MDRANEGFGTAGGTLDDDNAKEYLDQITKQEQHNEDEKERRT